MTPNHEVLFGIGVESGVHQVSEMLGHARLADNAGLDVVSLSDHPYFADRIDAYAALGFVLGATTNLTGRRFTARRRPSGGVGREGPC
jgi:alkanesulfonate monooxygenase SsuD/methylene tetrahydromethanopterin reductase-like flavin-dependent oxidoreductase (luciferase family)